MNASYSFKHYWNYICVGGLVFCCIEYNIECTNNYCIFNPHISSIFQVAHIYNQILSHWQLMLHAARITRRLKIKSINPNRIGYQDEQSIRALNKIVYNKRDVFFCIYSVCVYHYHNYIIDRYMYICIFGFSN